MSLRTLKREQVEAFREVGYFNAGRLFDDAELDEMRAEYDLLVARPMRIGEDGETPFHYSPLLHIQSETMRRYCTSPKLVRIALDLLETDIRLFWDQAVSKPPGATSEVPWHQDNGYGPVVPEEYVTCTVGLDATTKENGCLWIQPGSHRSGPTHHRATDSFFYRGYDGPERGVAVEQEKGEVLVFSSLTMHRTGPNLSTGPRRSWVIQFCDASTRNGKTGLPFDDRLIVAKDGAVLDEPYSERKFDLAAVAREARRR